MKRAGSSGCREVLFPAAKGVGHRTAAALLGFIVLFTWLVLTPARARQEGNGQTESGRIVGAVLSAETGLSLAYTNVQVFELVSEGDTLGVDAGGTFANPPDGGFRLVLPPGRYRLRASYVSYHPAELMPVEVRAGEITNVVLRLEPMTIAVAPIEVRAKIVRDTEVAVLTQRRQSVAVSDAVSAEQIKKTADSDAAEALQRVTGLSVVDGRFIFVRGLGERYSATLINGSPVGSPEPNKRVISLDLIPAALIDNVFVQKTYTPNQPAEFGGGTVDISTRDFPGRRIWSVSVSSGMASGTTGATFSTYDGGDYDFLGFDDGSRDIPDIVEEYAGDRPVTVNVPDEKLTAMGRAFSKVWVPEQEKAPPPLGLSLSYGNEVELMGRPLGFILGGVWKTSYDSYDHSEETYVGGEDTDLLTAYDVSTSKAKVNLGAIASIGYRTGEHSELHLRTFYNRIAEDEVREYEGINNDHGYYLRNVRFKYVAREIWASNIGLKHEIPWLNNSVFEWRASLSTAQRDEPDRREYNYEYHERGPYSWWNLSTRGTGQGFSRIFGALEDSERSFDASWLFPFRKKQRADDKPPSLQIGYHHSNKDREAGYRRFIFANPDGGQIDLKLPPESLMVDEKIGASPREFRLEEYTRGTDQYFAGQEINATFAVADIPLVGRLRVMGGVRFENWVQTAETYSPYFIREPDTTTTRLAKNDVLPAVNLTYPLSTEWILRAGYSQTISRPDLRELSPFVLHNYNSGYSEAGNDSLQRARITNYDLRAEFYPSPTELIALSGFYKKLYDPIEYTLHSSGNQLRRIPRNGEGGFLYGAEFEMRVGLGRFYGPLGPFSFGGNLTLVESETRLPKSGSQTSNDRPLQGQSPYVINALLFYDPRGKPYSGSIVYNRFGERLDGVGAFGMPDIYEAARATLDATVSLRFGSTKIKLAGENLLDSEEVYEQGHHTIRRSSKGRSYSISISRKG